MRDEVVARNAQITTDWAGGRHTFRLDIGQLEELQEACDAGPEFIWARLETRAYRVKDVTEPIRLGLIGGGLKPDEARKLVRRYVETRPLAENIRTAQKILAASIAGVPDEPAKKDGEAETRSAPQTSRMESSDSPSFTASAA